MDNLFYKDLIKELPIGYACHKIICDSNGEPFDYEYIEVNKAFEKFTGLIENDIIGKTICSIMPEIKNDPFNWIGRYGKVALFGGSESFEQYSAPLDRWYRINVLSPKKDHFVTYFTDITKEKLQINEHKMLLVTLNEAVFELNEQYVFENVIAPDDAVLFIPRDQIMGKSINQIFPVEFAELFAKHFKIAKAKGKKQAVEYSSILDGDNRWFSADIAFAEINKSSKYVVKITDITKEKQTNQALNELNSALEHSDQLLFSLIDSIPDLVFYKNSNFIYLGCNKAFEEFVGKPKSEIVGKTDFDIFDEDTATLFRSMDVQMVKTGHMRKNEEFVPYPDGRTVCLETLKAPYLNKRGNVIGLIGLSRDISERKENEEKLLQTTEELERFFSVNLDLLCIANTDGYFVKINKAWESTLGYSLEDLEGKRFLDLIHPDDIEPTLKTISKLKDQEQVLNFVNRYRTINGKYRYIEWCSHPYGNHIYAAARDITQRKLMEEFLYLQKEKLQTTLMSIGDGVISVDKNQKVAFMNIVAQKLTGWSRKDALGKPFAEIFNIINEKTKAKTENPITKVLATGNIVELANHTMLINKDGKEFAIEDSAAPIRDKQGEIQGVVLIFRDVTEKKKVRNEIEYLSFHDYLTGLYNRRFYEEELARLNVERNLPLSIIMIDVNGLKLTNDAFGHQMGDELLKRVSEIIKYSCRADDIISRIGGDEFAIILPKTDGIEADIICKRITEKASKSTIESVIVSVAVGYDTKIKSYQEISDSIKVAENYMYKNKIKTSRTMRNQTVQLIIENLTSRYENEQIHIERVRKICHHIGLAMDMSQDEIKILQLAGYLHDIGKIMLPCEILNKSDKLTELEYEQIKRHSEAGYQILKSVEEYSGIAEFVLCHHERWDGNGYPRKLKGENIPLISRVITVADAFESMTGARPYKKSLNTQEAIEELTRCSGTQFDPDIVDVFINKVLNHKTHEEIMEAGK